MRSLMGCYNRYQIPRKTNFWGCRDPKSFWRLSKFLASQAFVAVITYARDHNKADKPVNGSVQQKAWRQWSRVTSLPVLNHDVHEVKNEYQLSSFSFTLELSELYGSCAPSLCSSSIELLREVSSEKMSYSGSQYVKWWMIKWFHLAKAAHATLYRYHIAIYYIILYDMQSIHM